MKKISLNHFSAFICFLSFVALACTLFAEFYLKHVPCKFCLWQRGVYIALFGLAALFKKFPRIILPLMQIVLSVGLAVTIIHNLVEFSFIDMKCSLRDFDFGNLENSCQNSWLFLGMPIAFYNALIFLGVFILSFFVKLPIQKKAKIVRYAFLKRFSSAKFVFLFLLMTMIGSLCFGSEDNEKCQYGDSCSQNSHIAKQEREGLYIFMDSEVPEAIWLSLSEQLAELKGTFVLRGFPKGNPELLAQNILNLRKKGILADIVIDPVAFKRFNVKTSPTFVIVDGEVFDLISGSVNLENALEQLANFGETNLSKVLFEKLRKQQKSS